MTESLENNQENHEKVNTEKVNTPATENAAANPGKKKMSLAEFKVKSFVTQVKVDQMQFLKTAGG